MTSLKNKFARSKISSSTAAMLFAAIFSPAQSACNFDTSADRNVCNSRLCDRLRLSAIIWKQLSLRSSATCDLRSSSIIRKPAIKLLKKRDARLDLKKMPRKTAHRLPIVFQSNSKIQCHASKPPGRVRSLSHAALKMTTENRRSERKISVMTFTAGFFIRNLSTDWALFFRHASFLTRKSNDYHQIQDEKKTLSNFGSFLLLGSSNSVGRLETIFVLM